MIFGPTGVGKSKLGIEIAKKYNGEIISMDSMQAYNELDILTNKVTTEEAEGIPHHLLSIQSVEDQFTVRDFVREADKLIADIRERGKLPILVGGTTYYAFSFFLRSGDGSVSKNEEIMEQIESLTSLDEAERQSELGNLLKTLDPEAYKLVWNNPKKIETYLNNCALHETLLQRNKSSKVVNENTLVFWISCDRKVLNERIDKRADQMVTNGLIDEIKSFEEKYGAGLDSKLT